MCVLWTRNNKHRRRRRRRRRRAAFVLARIDGRGTLKGNGHEQAYHHLRIYLINLKPPLGTVADGRRTVGSDHYRTLAARWPGQKDDELSHLLIQPGMLHSTRTTPPKTTTYTQPAD